MQFANDVLYFYIVNLFISVYNAFMNFLNFELKNMISGLYYAVKELLYENTSISSIMC